MASGFLAKFCRAWRAIGSFVGNLVEVNEVKMFFLLVFFSWLVVIAKKT